MNKQEYLKKLESDIDFLEKRDFGFLPPLYKKASIEQNRKELERIHKEISNVKKKY